MTKKMTKKAMQEQQVRIATIYNRSPKTKAELRAESQDAITLFLKRGGVIEYGKPSRKKTGSKMSGKTTRYVSGTSGFANGYPRRSTGA